MHMCAHSFSEKEKEKETKQHLLRNGKCTVNVLAKRITRVCTPWHDRDNTDSEMNYKFTLRRR
jgi:hypothetical protein